jgi:hypothetical protein
MIAVGRIVGFSIYEAANLLEKWLLSWLDRVFRRAHDSNATSYNEISLYQDIPTLIFKQCDLYVPKFTNLR